MMQTSEKNSNESGIKCLRHREKRTVLIKREFKNKLKKCFEA